MSHFLVQSTSRWRGEGQPLRILQCVARCLLSACTLGGAALARAEPAPGDQWKWVASWTTAIGGVFTKVELPPGSFPPAFSPEAIAELMKAYKADQPEFRLALPDGEASDQTFRMIVKPDLWGDTVRVRFSNVFGTQALVLAAAAVGLQEYGGHLVAGTNVPLRFSGRAEVSIPAGGQVLSDAVRLSFVTEESRRWLRGRNLAISFAVSGKSGPLSSHHADVNSYISAPHSGDHTRDDDDTAFPCVTQTYFLVNELDVLADPDTAVVCALGDSLTDGGRTVNGHDGWSDDLSRRLHWRYGEKVSVVNMGLGSNTVVCEPKDPPGTPQPVVKRLDRDVLGIAGLTAVVWLEGINDLGWGQSKPGPVIEGYKQVVARLHARGIVVVGATLTPSLRPNPTGDKLWAPLLAQYSGPQTDAYRRQLNDFIRTSGIFDSVADMARATEDPATVALFKEFDTGDYLHPNRVGHQAMAAAVDLEALAPGKTSPMRQ